MEVMTEVEVHNLVLLIAIDGDQTNNSIAIGFE